MATPTPAPDPTPQAAPAADPIVATYQGAASDSLGAEFITGVPAHDLTQAEYDALSPELQQQVQTTPQSNGQPLYAVAGAAPRAQATAPPSSDPQAPPPPEAPPPPPHPAQPVQYPAPDPATTPVLTPTPPAAPAPPTR